MKPRTCYLWLFIANAAGTPARYGARPLSADELGQSVAGVRLTNFSQDPSPVYQVRLAGDGQASCDCPQHGRTGACKHADALVAAGLLPAGLVGVLQEQRRLLDGLEEEAKRHSSTVSNLLASVSNLTEKNARLQHLLDEAQDTIREMEKPKRRRRVTEAA